MIRRFYVDAGWGQVHGREAGAGPAPCLVCLHATAYSGRSLAPLLALPGRRVVALDTPGYGGSDGPAEPVAFERYADAVGDALDRLEGERPVDLFGYHTGALIALDLAARRPERVRRLVLIGVPFFQADDQAAWRARLVRPTRLTEDFESFRKRWDYLVANRPAGMSLARGMDNFADELAVYPREWFAHHALFDFAARRCLPLVRQQVLVINPDSPLAPASRAAAALMPYAILREMPALSGAIFDTGIEVLGREMTGFLDAACAAAEVAVTEPD